MADYAIHDTTLTGIANVIRKKDGTQALIDPADYADRINLMGMLEVKTASGAIASISDGADDVPVKSCVVSFTPSGGGGTPSSPVAIVGCSGLTVTNKDNMTTPTQTDTYTDTFGQTIYGGTRDLVTEKVSVTWGYITFDGSNDEVWQKHGSIASWFYIDNAITDGYVNANENNFMVCNEGVQLKYATVAQMTNGQFAFGQPSQTTFRLVFKNTDFTEVTDFKTWLSSNPMTIAYKLATPTEITGLTSHNINTRLGDNNFYADTGTMSVEYRSSGTETIVSPTLITKSITANGTYQASSDNADGYSSVSVTVSANVGTKSITSNGTYTASSESLDGYSSVTVEVPPYSFMPAYTLTKIVDNSTQQSSFTFTEDYHNYQMLKIVLYNSSSQIYDNIYVLPSGIDKAFTYSSNHFCVNQMATGYSNIYVTYNQDSLLTWSRVANRNANIYEIYGMTFTNATMTTEVIYSRDALTSGNVTPTPPTGKNFFDYDAIIYMFNTTDANITAFSKWWLSKPKTSISTDTEGYGVPLFVYNNGKPVVMTETSIGTYNFFYVVGINFTAT